MLVSYAIKETTLKSGSKIFTPLAKIHGKFPFLKGMSQWSRIVNIYNKYYLLDIFDEDEDFRLTLEDCQEHIKCYENQRRAAELNSVIEANYINVSINNL